MFTAPAGGLLRVPGLRRRVWLPTVERAGLAPLRIHDLRHTAVSLWIAAGVDVKTIAVRAGHSSVKPVLDRYGHLRERDDDPELDALDAMRTGARADAHVHHLCTDMHGATEAQLASSL